MRGWECKRKTKRAFQLVEVVLSLALTSFALVSILGLLPMGIKLVEDARRDTLSVEIARSLQLQIQGLARSELQALDSSRFYFDQEGMPTSTVGGESPPIYVATMSLSPPAESVLPGMSASGRLHQVQVRILAHPSGQERQRLSFYATAFD